MNEFPRNVDEITTNWLTHVLRKSGAISDASVVELAIDSLDGGFVGEVRRLTLLYDRDQINSPRTLVVKFSKEDEAQRRMLDERGLYRSEVGAYETLGNSPGIRLPICYMAEYSPSTGHSCLVIEDLGHLRSTPPFDGLSDADTRNSVAYLVRLHSNWWNDPRLSTFDWLLDAADETQAHRDHRLFTQLSEKFLTLAGDQLPQGVEKILRRLQPSFGELALRRGMGRATLNHGDFRVANLFFDDTRSGADAVVPVDWQATERTGPGKDLAVFHLGSLSIADQRRYGDALVRSYHDQLVESGIQDISFDQLITNLRLGLLYRTLVLTSVATRLIDSSNGYPPVFLAICERMQTLVDWNCEKVIPR